MMDEQNKHTGYWFYHYYYLTLLVRQTSFFAIPLQMMKCLRLLRQEQRHLRRSQNVLQSLFSSSLINYRPRLETSHFHGITSTTSCSTRRLLSSEIGGGDGATSSDDDKKVKMLSDLISPSLAKRIHEMSLRHDEIMGNLQSSNNSHNVDTKELSSLSPVSRLYEDFSLMVEEIESIQELKKQSEEEDDTEMLDDCRTELEELNAKIGEISEKMTEAALPKNEDDFGADAILEIRAGTGGDEACLFSSDLMAAYEKAVKGMGWKFEILSTSRTDLNGIKEAAVSISGSGGGGNYGGYGNEGPTLGPYGFLKFESGVHRVQRVPVNDVRIHTSAASVVVLPAPNDSSSQDEILPQSELRIETMRASGAGGQHVNTTDSAVRITHIPTGITAAIQDERSQHKNKAKAVKLISARVRDKLKADEAKERGDLKNALRGGGDRSERIRTYNYPQDRITDHRCKQSEHGIEKLLSGGGELGLVGAFAPFLRQMERKEILEELEVTKKP